MNLCVCGCNREVSKEQNQYIHGHSNFWKRVSEDEKNRVKSLISQKMKGISLEMRFGEHAEEIRQRLHNVNLGKHHSQKTKDKIRSTLLGRPRSEQERHAISIGLRNNSERKKHEQKESGKRRTLTQEHKNKISLTLKEKGITRTIEEKKRLSELKKEWWKNPLNAKKAMAHRSPNTCELELLSILQKLGFAYDFVGNGLLIIDGKNPDFFNKSTKKIIELFGDFYHMTDDPHAREQFFIDRGFPALVIWTHEFKNKQDLISKIKIFENQIER